MGQPTEGFSFSDGPFLQYHDVDTTDGTINPQVIGFDFTSPMQYISQLAIGSFLVEPSVGGAFGQKPLDNFARVIFTAVIRGGSATGTLSFRRGTGGEVFTPPEFVDIVIAQVGTQGQFPFIIDRLPMNFMRSLTGAANADSLRTSLTVTPGTTAIRDIAYSVWCVPIIGQGSATNPPGGRGQVLGVSIQGNR